MKHNFLTLFLTPLNLPQKHVGAEKMERKKAFLLTFLAVALGLWGSVARVIAQEAQPKQAAKQGKSGQPKSAAVEIRAVLDAQVTAWNAGKLEEFMVGYWRSPDLTFFSGGGESLKK